MLSMNSAFSSASFRVLDGMKGGSRGHSAFSSACFHDLGGIKSGRKIINYYFEIRENVCAFLGRPLNRKPASVVLQIILRLYFPKFRIRRDGSWPLNTDRAIPVGKIKTSGYYLRRTQIKVIPANTKRPEFPQK